jgi:three-Cys-motif partner protein
LAKYLDTWGGIIFSRLRNRAKLKQSKGHVFDPHFVYIDCFAYLGRYAGDTLRSSDSVDGSPLIGVKSLDKLANSAQQAGVAIRTNSILIEKDPKVFDGLLESLTQAGLENRVKLTEDFHQLGPGEIAAVQGDAISLASKLVRYTTTGFTWSFYLIDPYGPSGIPYDFVKSLVGEPHHDVMINFIYEDLVRKAGMARSAKINAQQQQLLDYWTVAFGSDKWKDIGPEVESHGALRDALWGIPLDDIPEHSLISDRRSAKLKERKFVDLYRRVLRKMDPDLTVKLVDLQFPEKERTMFYLFLTTHDPTGALALNKILFEAKLWEHELRYLTRYARKTAPPPQQPALFALDPPQPEIQAPPRPLVEDIADDILKRMKSRSASRRDVYRALADEIFFAEEVDKGIRFLKKHGKAEFDDKLNHDTVIKFSE